MTGDSVSQHEWEAEGGTHLNVTRSDLGGEERASPLVVCKLREGGEGGGEAGNQEESGQRMWLTRFVRTCLSVRVCASRQKALRCTCLLHHQNRRSFS